MLNQTEFTIESRHFYHTPHSTRFALNPLLYVIAANIEKLCLSPASETQVGLFKPSLIRRVLLLDYLISVYR